MDLPPLQTDGACTLLGKLDCYLGSVWVRTQKGAFSSKQGAATSSTLALKLPLSRLSL